MATWQAESSSSSSPSSSGSRDSDDPIYVAVGIDFEQNKLNLLWAIENFPGSRFCILHVHQPAKMIPLVSGKFPANRLEEHELKEFIEVEKKIIRKIMDDYLQLFDQVSVDAEKICVEMDDIGKGIVELIYLYDIKTLVMGAAANKHYSEEMIDLKSTKAKYIQHRAPHACQIFYVCNGYHIYTWEGDSTGSSNGFRDPAYVMQQRTEANGLELELYENDESDSDIDNPNSSGRTIDQLYGQLDEAYAEAEKYKQEAYEESRRRGEAENKANKARFRAQAMESLYAKELKRRKETEEALAREKYEHQRTKKEWEEERLVIMDQRLLQQIQASDFNSRIEELKNENLSVVEQCKEYERERDELLHERDNVLQLAQEIAEGLCREESGSCSSSRWSLSTFNFAEIEDATCNFDPLLRIAETRHGNVYKGVLHHTPVAIKLLNQQSRMGRQEFQLEVDLMSKLRHPNIVNLIGSSEENCALIYEYSENGSLDDRLKCKNNSPPIPWQTRLNIAAELCSVLSFLHSISPKIVHGDLNSGNILLDSNFSCKLSDFGSSQWPSLLENLTILREIASTDGTESTTSHLDPHFLATGELSPKSDVYSFGIVLLQLLTGWPSISDPTEIRLAVDDEQHLSSLLDPLAGNWPVVQAQELARLALSCCDSDPATRPDVESEAWGAIERTRASCSATEESSFRDNEEPPSYFVCPILQEVMEDPHVAADGYTYEKDAMRDWLHSGHNTSPMTNLELRDLNLIPNYSLRSAIIQWKERN